MFAISEALDAQLVAFMGTLIGLLGLANIYFLNKIKKDTGQVNTAVNHVEPGKKTLTQRVDRIEETLHTIQYDMDVAKKTAIDMSAQTADNSEKIDDTKTMVEELMKSHVANVAKLDEILDVMPKRKTDSDQQ